MTNISHPVGISKIETLALQIWVTDDWSNISEATASIGIQHNISRILDAKTNKTLENSQVWTYQCNMVVEQSVQQADSKSDEDAEAISSCSIKTRGLFTVNTPLEQDMDDEGYNKFVQQNIIALMYSYSRDRIDFISKDFPGHSIKLPVINVNSIELGEIEDSNLNDEPNK